MAKDPPPLLGFNNNVRHQGRVFHIQTEDSGVKHPRIVTHLFADGGRIIKTTRTDYAEHIGQKDLMPIVRRLMKEQHKAMFIALRSGDLDDVLVKVCGPLAGTAARDSRPSGETLAAGVPSPSQVASERPTPEPWRMTPAQGMAAVASPGQPQEPSSSPIASEIHAVSVGSGAPEALERDSGGVQELGRAAEQALAPRSLRPPPPPKRNRTPLLGTPTAGGEAGRYAPSRPAAIFGQAPSPEQQSIFGENVISEKSLDEVILSYLAEDLEGPPQK